MLIIWGVAFIAVGQEQPRLKGRNFKKTALKGIRTLQSVSIRGRSSTSSGQGDCGISGREDLPAWERTAQQAREVSLCMPCVR